MRVLVAGASGAVGRQLVPRLFARGHEVFGIARSAAKATLVEALGATPLVADALDPSAVSRLVARAEPEVIVHQLTALSAPMDTRRPGRWLAATNRLRTEATDHLLSAGRAAGTRRVVAHSDASWPYAREGAWVKRESDSLDPDPPAQLHEALAAIRYLESAVCGAKGMAGIVLRCGLFYGPGTTLELEPDGEYVVAIRARRFPVIGSGEGVWSFVHVADAADATALAVEGGKAGIYNITDDAPTEAREWVPRVAEAIGAEPPRRLPRWLGRPLAGEASVAMMTELRGAANEKAKAELGWEPGHTSVWEYLADRQVSAAGP